MDIAFATCCFKCYCAICYCAVSFIIAAMADEIDGRTESQIAFHIGVNKEALLFFLLVGALAPLTVPVALRHIVVRKCKWQVWADVLDMCLSVVVIFVAICFFVTAMNMICIDLQWVNSIQFGGPL